MSELVDLATTGGETGAEDIVIEETSGAVWRKFCAGIEEITLELERVKALETPELKGR